jgi:eukaryotic-like serine/threonine-protein kinase
VYPQVFGKYVLERELSRGGMARVVLATLRGAGGFEKKLVVKQIRDELSFDQQFVRRFVEEAKTTVALSHPNIVPVYELGVEQGTYFLAMELVEGCSVAELVREQNPDGGRRVLTPEEGAYLGMEVCRALDYAHRRMKVVHRDITPRNVMLDEEGQVKLIDFGIAAPARVAGHEILGSPGHMPPEQVEGKELGPPTDIFAVAVLLMEAWSGIAPFRRATPEECDEAMRRPHPRPSDFDPRLIPLDDVIVRAMKLDPRERQQDAAALGRKLRAFLQGTDVTDIARGLGDRVRDLCEATSEPAPASTDGTGRSQNPSLSDMGTQTFAARDETIHWSTPPSSQLDEPPGASTRRLEVPDARELPADLAAMVDPPPLGTTPISMSEVSLRTSTPSAISLGGGRSEISLRRKPAARPDPAMSIPTPLMVEPVGVGGDEVLRSARAAQEAAREARDEGAAPRRKNRVDTLATRPLETPVKVERVSRPASSSARSRTWGLVGFTGVVALGAVVAWRVRASDAHPDGATTSLTSPLSTSSVLAPPPSASAAAVLAPSADTSATVPPGVASAAAAPPAATPSAAPSSTPATEKGGRALVSLLGDPGTRVSVDGTSRGSTPVRISLEPGQHDVRFQFDPTGESRGERFSVKAGEKVTVRAEFTGASPTVRIHH